MSHELPAYLSVFNLFVTQWILAILSKGCESDNFESHNSLKLNFMNIRGLLSNCVECETFLELNSPYFWYSDSGDLSVKDYLSLIQKDSITHMYGLAVYVKEGLPFLQNLSLENSALLTFVFKWLYFTQCRVSFSSINHLLHLYARFMILFHLP